MAAAEIALTILLALLVLLLLATYARRRLIARGEALLVCAERTGRQGRWHMRLARYDAVSLELFSLGGLSLTPTRRLCRGLDGLLGVETEVEEGPALIPDPVVLQCVGAGAVVELAVSAADYTTLRSWLESSPPGIVRSVA